MAVNPAAENTKFKAAKPGLFNISVTSFNKTQGTASPVINNPLVDRITPTTSSQLLSFYH